MSIEEDIPEDFSSIIYTPFDSIRAELDRRRSDKELMRKVNEFFKDTPLEELMHGKPRAMLSRAIATPNAELIYFLDLARDLGLDPLVLEYPDKFVTRNWDKYHVARMLFYRKKNNLRSFPVASSKIVDFNKHEGKKFREIPTLWGESIVDFHHNLLLQVVPELEGKIIDFTDWFSTTRNLSDYYYRHYLALFVCHGVLFENFLKDDKEERSFIREKFFPSFKEVERIFGVKPLIFPILPLGSEKHQHWVSYHESLLDKLPHK